MSSDILSEAIVSLLKHSESNRHGSYYGYLLTAMTKEYTTKIPTAGVTILKDRIHLLVNKEFFESISPVMRADVLVHECLHIINDHIDRYKSYKAEASGTHNASNANIAMDAAIMGSTTSLHEMGVTPKKLGEMLKRELKEGETFEYYYEQIKEAIEENPELAQAVGEAGPIDSHDDWDNGQVSDDIKENVIKKAVEDAGKKAGSMPKSAKNLLDRMNQSSTNWRRILKQFIQYTEKRLYVKTRRRRNRRYGLMYPGKRKFPEVKLALVLDSSGSVSDSAFKQFFAEIDKISNQIQILKVIDSDAEVQAVYDYVKGMKIERSGYGGTMYSPALRKAEELGLDGVIYFGDGDCFDEKVYKPSIPVLWAMVEGCTPPVEWGTKCEIKVTESY